MSEEDIVTVETRCERVPAIGVRYPRRCCLLLALPTKDRAKEGISQQPTKRTLIIPLKELRNRHLQTRRVAERIAPLLQPRRRRASTSGNLASDL